MNSPFPAQRASTDSALRVRGRITFVAALLVSLGLCRSGMAIPLQTKPDPNSAEAAAFQLLSKPIRAGQSTPVPVDRRPNLLSLPLAFEPVDEPTEARFEFAAHSVGYSVFVGPGAALLMLRGPGNSQDNRSDTARSSASRDQRSRLSRETSATRHTWLQLRFEGADLSRSGMPLDQLPGVVHRLQGSDPGQWRTHLKTHQKVRYPEVYPGIDLLFHGSGRELEYDFILQPGASPETPRLRFDGAETVTLTPEGDLQLKTPVGIVLQRRPIAYQDGPEGREFVAVEYRQVEDGGIAFSTGSYDPQRPLVIDPVLGYSTFLGGPGFDRAWDIAVASSGAAVVVGETESLTPPDIRLLSTNAFQTNFQGGLQAIAGDAFVAKLNTNGTAFEWFTYFGGEDLDVGLTIALGAADEPVIGGFTTSTNFPLTATAYQKVINGEPERFTGRRPLEGFVARLTADGANLVASTVYGAESDDLVLDLAVLGDGRLVVVGSTASTNLPVGTSALQSTNAGSVDGFFAVFSADASTLEQATYIGGNARDTAEGLAVDVNGVAHIAGITLSTNFPTAAALQTTNAGFADAFVTGLRIADGTRVYGTFLGGSGEDLAYRAALGPNGSVWIVGETRSTNFPTAQALQSTNFSTSDGFITRLAPDGSALEFSTYFGGNSLDALWDVAVDSIGTVHVVGGSFSAAPPLGLTNGWQTTNAGSSEVLIGSLATNGTVFTTFLGGIGEDIAFGVAADPAGNIYAAGRTLSVSFPVTSTNVAQPTYGGGSADSFLIKVVQEPALTAALETEGIAVSWPAPNPGFILETASAVDSPGSWTRVPDSADLRQDRYVVHLPLAATNSLFRLRWSP